MCYLNEHTYSILNLFTIRPMDKLKKRTSKGPKKKPAAETKPVAATKEGSDQDSSSDEPEPDGTKGRRVMHI